MAPLTEDSPPMDHWISDWEDVTALQHGLECVFAARHRETDVIVALVPTAGELRGGMTVGRREPVAYRRVVRPRQGASVLKEHTKTYRDAGKQTALARTHEWLESHPDGAESGVSES